MTDALLGIADTYPAAELLHVADQVERAKEIGEYVRDQYYRVQVYDPRWHRMIGWALREAAARAQCSPGIVEARTELASDRDSVLNRAFNVLLLIEWGLPEDKATRVATQWEKKCAQLKIAKDQRNDWQKVAKQAGVCMSCAMGSPEAGRMLAAHRRSR